MSGIAGATAFQKKLDFKPGENDPLTKSPKVEDGRDTLIVVKMDEQGNISKPAPYTVKSGTHACGQGVIMVGEWREDGRYKVKVYVGTWTEMTAFLTSMLKKKKPNGKEGSTDDLLSFDCMKTLAGAQVPFDQIQMQVSATQLVLQELGGVTTTSTPSTPVGADNLAELLVAAMTAVAGKTGSRKKKSRPSKDSSSDDDDDDEGQRSTLDLNDEAGIRKVYDNAIAPKVGIMVLCFLVIQQAQLGLVNPFPGGKVRKVFQTVVFDRKVPGTKGDQHKNQPIAKLLLSHDGTWSGKPTVQQVIVPGGFVLKCMNVLGFDTSHYKSEENLTPEQYESEASDPAPHTVFMKLLKLLELTLAPTGSDFSGVKWRHTFLVRKLVRHLKLALDRALRHAKGTDPDGLSMSWREMVEELAVADEYIYAIFYEYVTTQKSQYDTRLTIWQSVTAAGKTPQVGMQELAAEMNLKIQVRPSTKAPVYHDGVGFILDHVTAALSSKSLRRPTVGEQAGPKDLEDKEELGWGPNAAYPEESWWVAQAFKGVHVDPSGTGKTDVVKVAPPGTGCRIMRKAKHTMNRLDREVYQAAFDKKMRELNPEK